MQSEIHYFSSSYELSINGCYSSNLGYIYITSASVLTSTPWNLEAACSLRDRGMTATMFTDARFSYFNPSGFLKGMGFNGSTFIDTTVENQFGMTYRSPKNTTIIVGNTLISR